MPIPEERLYHPGKLNIWFAVSSILMTASILWMIAIDYDRPWHEHQDQHWVSVAALAHLDYLDAMRQDRTQEIEEAEQRLSDAQDLLQKTKAAELVSLKEELAEANLKFKQVNGHWSQVSQVLEVTRDTYEKAVGKHGEEHPVTQKAHDQVRAEEEEEETLRKDKEHWEDTKKQFESQIKAVEAPVRTADKKLRELQSIAEKALEKDMQYRGVLKNEGLFAGLPIVKTIINLPLLDFAAPKNTPARYQVNQLVLPDVKQQLNYLTTYTTDRCTTCHVSIDDPAFSRDQLARKLERSIPGINEAMQRMDLDPFNYPTPPVLDVPGKSPLPDGQVTEHWAELSRIQQDDYFDALLVIVNEYLSANGRKTISLKQPLLAHPDLDLFVTVDSPHPLAKMGCTVCHEGNPQETDFVLASHSPGTHKVRERWEEQYYLRRLGIPNTTFETVEHYWDRPMQLPKHTQASCSKCHTEIADIANFAGKRQGNDINLGRHLFATTGCVNCHAMDDQPDARRVGPDLSRVAAKLKPEFVQQWMFFPQKFRPSTWMPHLFLQENLLPGSANQFDKDPELRTETETAAISQYLFAVSNDWQPIEKPSDIAGDAGRGRDLFKQLGCLACHANIAEFGEEWIADHFVHKNDLDRETAVARYKGMTYVERVQYAMEHFATETDTFFEPKKTEFDPDAEYNLPTLSRVGPELSGIGSKVSGEWLYSWLMEPTHYFSETKMPSMRLLPDEAADITSYLMTLKNDSFDQHTFELTAPRREMADELIFSLLSSQRSERRSRSVMNDTGGELTKMIVSLIKSSLGEDRGYDLISAMSLEEKKLTFLGNKMISHYGCYACHLIPGFEEASPPGTNLTTWAQKPIAQLDFAFYNHAFHHMREEQEDVYGKLYLENEESEELNQWSPGENPKEQIAHTHAAFVKHKLRNPRIWDRGKIKRPYDKLKMPNFYFTDKQAEALTTYMLSRVVPMVSDAVEIQYENTTLGPIAKGRNLTRELNCVGCHQIEDNIPAIQQYFRREVGGKLTFDTTNAPPSLWGEGAKIQHQWFHKFLQDVEMLRPWLQVRMPTFNITGEQATQLVEYFAALSQYDSAKLKDTLAPIEEYVDKSASIAASEKADGKPRADWHKTESLEDSAKRLRQWALAHRIMRPAELDPLQSPEDRVRQAHMVMIERSDFMSRLYDVAYPFVEPPRPESPTARYEKGKSFLNDMGCLKCHVLGDMVPGPASNTTDFVQVYRLDSVRGEGDEAVAILNGNPYPVGSIIDGHKILSAENIYYEGGDLETKAIVEGPKAGGGTEQVLLQAATAPNLSLTFERLRREWVYNWMLEPNLIQPGTKMPQNFADGVSPYLDDPNYPGTSQDHIDLLVDFLFDAGQKGDRIPLPKLDAPSADEDFDEEGFDDEEFDD